MSISIKVLNPDDTDAFLELIRLFSEVFEMKNFRMPVNSHLEQLLAKENFIVVTANRNNVIVGGLTMYVLEQCYAVQPLAYIYDLAIDKKFQRQGIGTQLISFSKKLCRENGFSELFVQADTADDYAVQFYRSTGITNEEDVRHFYYAL